MRTDGLVVRVDRLPDRDGSGCGASDVGTSRWFNGERAEPQLAAAAADDEPLDPVHGRFRDGGRSRRV